MDILSNLNVFVSIIAGLVTIVTTFGSIKFWQKKATPTKQTVRINSSNKQTSYQVAPKLLSKLDWMEVLWLGLEDSFRARDGSGIIVAGFIGVFGSLLMFYAAALAGIIYLGLFIPIIILFYAYFVGRRIEKKVEEINRPKKRINNIQSN